MNREKQAELRETVERQRTIPGRVDLPRETVIALLDLVVRLERVVDAAFENHDPLRIGAHPTQECALCAALADVDEPEGAVHG